MAKQRSKNSENITKKILKKLQKMSLQKQYFFILINHFYQKTP